MCAFVRLAAQRGVLCGGRARRAVLERVHAPRSGQQPEPAASRTTRSYQAAVHKGSGHVRRVKRQLRARARRWGHARAHRGLLRSRHLEEPHDRVVGSVGELTSHFCRDMNAQRFGAACHVNVVTPSQFREIWSISGPPGGLPFLKSARPGSRRSATAARAASGSPRARASARRSAASCSRCRAGGWTRCGAPSPRAPQRGAAAAPPTRAQFADRSLRWRRRRRARRSTRRSCQCLRRRRQDPHSGILGLLKA